MKSYSARFLITTSLFSISAVLSLLGNYYTHRAFIMYSLLVTSMIYLIFGWYLFKAYHTEGPLFIRFLMGYFYSGIFIGPLFIAADWPFKRTLIWASIFWIILQTVIVVVSGKSIAVKGYRQLLIEAFLMLLVAVFLIISAN